MKKKMLQVTNEIIKSHTLLVPRAQFIQTFTVIKIRYDKNKSTVIDVVRFIIFS